MVERGPSRAIWFWGALLLAFAIGVGISIALFRPAPREPVAVAPSSRSVDHPANAPLAAGSSPLVAIPLHIELDLAKVDLGERLFHDVRLSGDDTISCATCHDLRRGGTDRLPFSVGINGALGDINAPTVFNSGFNFTQFWDGRAPTLEAQIDGPVNNPIEMGSSWEQVTAKLSADDGYMSDFAELYPEGITRDSIVDAIATFERSLSTPNSRFDQFLRGDTTALSEEEKMGYGLFLGLGCVECHHGIGIGGNMFQRMGAKNEYFDERGTGTDADLGRFNVTGDEFDRHRFKVPSLRNVAQTAPYFHDGSAPTLDEAVGVMARYQLARELKEEERHRLVAFLRTLTGEYQGKSLGASTQARSPFRGRE